MNTQTYNAWTTQFNAQIDGSGLAQATKTWIESLVTGANTPVVDPGATTYNAWTAQYDSVISSAFPNNTGIWLKSLVVGAGTPFPDAPASTVQGSNPPALPSRPPVYVTDCPTLAFSDDFKEGSNFPLSNWGPIVPPAKWITNKPDGFNFGGYIQPATDTFTYDTSSGHLVLKMHNYYQSSSQPHGDGNWYTGEIATAAWKNQAGGGATTGFMASAPCYWETSVWIPPLTSCDVPNAAGLWPSISLYTDPARTASVGSSCEIDLLEAYSIDYRIPHFSLHVWSSSGASLPGSSAVSPTLTDLSLGWHKYGVWIDTATIRYYLDDVLVFSAPTPPVVGLEPFYFMLANGYGGGWNVSLTPSQTYNMHVAYVACWQK